MADKLNEYTLGQRVETHVIVYNSVGDEVTPSSIKILWGKLVGNLIVSPTTWTYGTNGEITQESGLGSRYTATFDPTSDGLWSYRYEWSGNVKGAQERTVIVKKSGFYTS